MSPITMSSKSPKIFRREALFGVCAKTQPELRWVGALACHQLASLTDAAFIEVDQTALQ